LIYYKTKLNLTIFIYFQIDFSIISVVLVVHKMD